MPAYHSKFNDPAARCVGNMAILPLNTSIKGPAPKGDGQEDIIDEAVYFFKANIFFKTYEIKGSADRVLIYLTLYITECVKKIAKCVDKNEGNKQMYQLAIASFDIPGDPKFPLNAMYTKPKDKAETDQMRAYFLQLRQETGNRVLEKVFEGSEKPSKWWTCFAKRKFMDKSLSSPGQ